MAIRNFIPTVWSEHLLSALNQEYVGVANCNREYEGEIQGKGSSVKICGLNPITIGEYVKNTDIGDPQELNDYASELIIDQAKFFNFQIDDVDRVQASPKLMELALKSAAQAIAKDTDQFIYQLHKSGSVNTETFTDVPIDQLFKTILFAKEKLVEAGVTNDADLVLEVSPYMATMLLRSKMDTVMPNSEVFENGCIGSIAGIKVFVSNNIEAGSDGQYYTSHCYLRSKRAVAFAEQFSEIVAYRPEKRFAEAVKGLHLYGAKIVYPQEFYCLQFQYDDTGARM